MDVPFLLKLGRNESRTSCLEQYSRIGVILTMTFLAASQVAMSGSTYESSMKLFSIVTLLSRHYLVSLWEKWSIWKPSQLLLCITVYIVTLYNLSTAVIIIHNQSRLEGYAALFLPLVVFSFLDSLLFTSYLSGRDASSLTFAIYRRVVTICSSSLEVVYAQSVMPRLFAALDRLPLPKGYKGSSVTLGGVTYMSPPNNEPCIWLAATQDMLTLASVLLLLAMHVMIAARNKEVMHAVRSLGSWSVITDAPTGEVPEWSAAHAPYPLGSTVTFRGRVYKAQCDRNTCKPNDSTVSWLTRMTMANDVQVIDFLLGLALVLVGIVKYQHSHEFGGVAIMVFSGCAVLIHELSLRSGKSPFQVDSKID